MMLGFTNSTMEINTSLPLDDEKMLRFEMHSLINIFSVLISNLYELEELTGKPELVEKALSSLHQAGRTITSKHSNLLNDRYVEQLNLEILTAVENSKIYLKNDAGQKFQGVIEHILQIFNLRIEEMQRGNSELGKWLSFSIEEFKKDFDLFFDAVAKNSRGKYRIVDNPEEKTDNDYLIQFEVNAEHSNHIIMPLALKDVIRDLLANARKYTPRGGTISAEIHQNNEELCINIEDNGHGIPESEIKDVVKYGFRGSNVRDQIRTMGGGVGLTKAYFVTKSLDGRMWIDSALEKGTKIRIEVPVPADKKRSSNTLI